MSTAGRINKGATKFVPKRKQTAPGGGGGGGERASSATPSVAPTPTPRVHAHALAAIDEFALEESESERERERGTPRARGSASRPPPSPPRSSSPPKKAAGTAFAISATGPSKPPPSPLPVPAAAVAIKPSAPPKKAPPALAPADDDDEGSEPAPRTQRDIEFEAERAELAKVDRRDKLNAKRREAARAKRDAKVADPKGKKRAVPDEDDQEPPAAVAVEGEEPPVAVEDDEVPAPAAKKPRKPRARKPPPKTVEEEAEEDANGGPPPPDEEGPMLPPAPARAGKRPRAPRKNKAPAPQVEVGSDGEVDAYDILAPKKRKRKNATGERVKPSRMDLELAGEDPADSSSSDEDDPDLSMEEGSDGELRPQRRKKVKRTKGPRASPERVNVDPATTTMFDLATARDTLAGRVSERGKELTRKVEQKRLQRKAARLRMRDRAERKKRGESVSDDDDEADLDKANVDGKRSATTSRRGSPTPSNISRRSTPGPRQGSPALLDAVAAAMGRGDIDLMDKLGGKENDNATVAGSDDDDDDDGYGELVETEYAPQMRIVDGELVIDEASLEVDRAARAQASFTGTREVIEESARDRMVNSGTWGKQRRTEKWTEDETELLYDLLRQFGLDFEMIAVMFPSRTRKQIKAKWTKEDKLNPKKITAALYNPKKIDLVAYSKVTGKDYSGPIPEDPLAKIQQVRQELEAKALASGEPVYGNASVGKGKGKGKARNQDGNGSDDEGLGSDVERQLAAIGDAPDDDDDEEEERLRLEAEAESAAVDAEIAAAEAAEEAAKKQRKR